METTFTTTLIEIASFGTPIAFSFVSGNTTMLGFGGKYT